MNITGIKIRKVSDDEKMKAIVSVTVDDSLAIHDLKVIQGHDRLFVAMPSRRTPDGRFVDIVHPISKQLREEFEKEIISAYTEALKALNNPGAATAEVGKTPESDLPDGE